MRDPSPTVHAWTPWDDQSADLADVVVRLRAERDRMAWQLARPVPCPCLGAGAPSRKDYLLQVRFSLHGPPHAGEARWLCRRCHGVRPLQPEKSR